VSCYCCVIASAGIYDPLGAEGDVLGTCYNCHVHACGHHADRSADDAQYLCVLCVKTLLTASAFLRTKDSDYTRSLLVETGNEKLLTLRRDYAVQTVREFARAHPRMWEAITGGTLLLPPGKYMLTGMVQNALDPEGRELLVAAVALAIVLRIPREDIEAILLVASEDLNAQAPRRPGRQ
jgi:hypothetical protein